MDLTNKKTALDDSADIYQQREEKTQRERWKEMKTFREKWDYFKEYYIVKTVAIAVAIVLLAYLGYTILNPKPEKVFYAAIIDYVVPETARLTMEEEFFTYLEATEQQTIVFDDSFAFYKDYNYAIRRSFMTYVIAGDMDVIVMPESLFEAYVAYYTPLVDVLPTDLYEQLSEYFVKAPKRDAQGNVLEGTEQFYGIDITDVSLMQDTTSEERVILTVVGTSTHTENTVNFIKYLFECSMSDPTSPDA